MLPKFSISDLIHIDVCGLINSTLLLINTVETSRVFKKFAKILRRAKKKKKKESLDKNAKMSKRDESGQNVSWPFDVMR